MRVTTNREMECVQDRHIAARLARGTKGMTKERDEIETNQIKVMCGARARPCVGVGFMLKSDFPNMTTS